MLTLNRKRGESVIIGEDIKVTVVLVDGYTVKLGFEAPRNVKIVRSELKERKGKFLGFF